MYNANLPAFPRPKQTFGSGEDYHEIPAADGLSKREWLAGIALNGMLANGFRHGKGMFEAYARDSIAIADVILAELDKQPAQDTHKDKGL